MSLSEKKCPEGKVLNPKTNRCIMIKVKKECPEGKVLNLNTNRCIKIKESPIKINIPKQVKIESDFTQPQIDEMLTTLIKRGNEPIKHKYRGFHFFQEIYLLYLMKKYNAKCYTMSLNVIKNIEFPLDIELKLIKNKRPTKIQLNHFIEKTYHCIVNKDMPFVIIPLYILDEEFNSSHYNVLIYRRKQHQFEHFEPHGKYYISDYNKSEKIANTIQIYVDALNKVLVAKANIDPVKFIKSEQICPLPQGIQSLEETGRLIMKFKTKQRNPPEFRHEYEPEGYCTIWGLFFIELVLKNPDIPSDILVRSVIDKTSSIELINIARGYMDIVCNKLQEYYSILLGSPVSTSEVIDLLTTVSPYKKDIYRALDVIVMFERRVENENKNVTPEIYEKEVEKFLKELDNSTIPEIIKIMVKNYLLNLDVIFTPTSSSTKTKKVRKCPEGKFLNEKTNRCNKIKTVKNRRGEK